MCDAMPEFERGKTTKFPSPNSRPTVKWHLHCSCAMRAAKTQ